MSEKPKKRYVIPIDFGYDFLSELKAEANRLGMKTSCYLRHLIATHPARKKNGSR